MVLKTGHMGRTIWVFAVVIVAAFVVGILSANPVVEAVGGWKAAVIELNDDISDIELFLEERSDFWEFLEESGEEFFESQVYEVSDTTVIPGSTNPNVDGDNLQLRCLDGDWLYSEGIPFSMTAEPLADIVANDVRIGASSPHTKAITESPTRNISDTKLIGYDVTPRREQVQQPNEVFDITVVVSILCLSPSP